MKARTLFERGSPAGPWWVRLSAFNEDACMMGLSWHRYLDRFELCIDPLPFVSLRIMRKLARSLAPRLRACRLVDYGDEYSPLQLGAMIIPSYWTLGATWFRDLERFELIVHPLPMLALFYTRLKDAPGQEMERVEMWTRCTQALGRLAAWASRRPQASAGDWPKAHQYTCRARWSEEDGEYVATCDEFPSLSWLSDKQDDALNGLRRVLRDVLWDMQLTGETPPKPTGAA